MNIFEKIAAAVLLVAAVISAALYGVWEDKVMLFAPLLMLIYAALATWVAAASRGRGQVAGDESQPSSFRFPVSSFKTPPAGVWLLLFFLYSAVMIPFSVLPYEAKISTLRLGCYIGVYWAAANILSRFPRRKAVWITLLTALVFVALYSLVQHKVAPNLIFGMERYTGYWESGVGGRLGGTYQCPNHIAHLMQMWIPLCLVLLFLPRTGWFWRLLCAYAVPLFLILIYQTQSRAGLLGTITGVGVTVLLLILRKSRKWFFIALIAAPLLGAGALGALWAGSSMFRERMQPVVRVASEFFAGNIEKAISVDFRPQTWADGMVMFLDRPVTGFGPGNYELVFPEYRHRVFANRMLTVHPHNEYVELLTEYGLIGALLVAGVLISFCVPMIRLIRTSGQPHHVFPAIAMLAALAGTAVHGFFDFELRIFPNALMLALLAGCAAAPLLRNQKSEVRDQKTNSEWSASDLPPSLRLWWTGRPRISGPNGRTSVLRPLTSFILLLAAAWAVQVMSSEWIRARGSRLLEERSFDPALARFRLASRIDPHNWKAHWGIGQVLYHHRYRELDPDRKRELAEEERAAYAAAFRHNVKKEEVTYGLGRVELFLGHQERGLDLMRQAADYKRFNDFYWRKLGIELRRAGLYEEALERFEYARKLDRSNKTTRRNIEWLKERVGVNE